MLGPPRSYGLGGETVPEQGQRHGISERWGQNGTNPPNLMIFPQQRKLMGSSAQNSSGVRWCRRRVRFNGRFREALVQTPGQVQLGSGEGSGEGLGGLGAATSGSTGFRRRRSGSRARFNEVPEKVLEKVREGLGAARFNEASSRFWCDSGSVSA